MDPITAAAVTSITKLAITETVKKSIGKAYEHLENRKIIKQGQNFKDKFVEYHCKLLQIQTLASQERKLFINDIYVPLTVNSPVGVSIEISDSTLLEADDRVKIIKGVAGQGKSTILKKLLANNAVKTERLPIFYELKNYKGGSIENAIADNMHSYGVELSSGAISSLLEESAVKLYLDAFDEVIPEHRNKLLEEITRIINRYSCHLICTSRPDTELDSLVSAETYTVQELNEHQVFAIIKKVCTDPEKADELCESLKRNKLYKAGELALRTPILVTLYSISYNLGEEIPETLSQFYSNIFETVFFRHDNIKGKINRERHWNEDRRIYRELFDYTCYSTQKTGQSNFTWHELTSHVTNALKYLNKDKSLSDKISTEICKITNLIIEDGYNEYKYIHKSIQEFFSASFIQSLNIDKKSSFYSSCLRNRDHGTVFSNTLRFLKDIDRYGYYENYLIPGISELLQLSSKKLDKEFTATKELTVMFSTQGHYLIDVVKTKSNRSGREGVDVSLSPLMFNLSSTDTEFKAKTFRLTAEILRIKIAPDEAFRIAKSANIKEHDGTYTIALGKIIEKLDITEDEIANAISTASNILFSKDYNQALDDTTNRNSFLENDPMLTA